MVLHTFDSSADFIFKELRFLFPVGQGEDSRYRDEIWFYERPHRDGKGNESYHQRISMLLSAQTPAKAFDLPRVLSALGSRNIHSTYRTGLFSGINEIRHVKCFASCLAHRMPSINTSSSRYFIFIIVVFMRLSPLDAEHHDRCRMQI